ncbi:TonB-dependent siderophore receptor [Chroococcus sp. FPU101]|uniref:TonB-dependent siderophore receptor n=1 Tax=Chroococcus sp. FPU101 TaxID=1974212 RepID=UPI001AA3C9D2|nr:TonB-dependent siderophore receptor [Chroococcus sp. FPU101]GFE67441.1 ferrichrome iron receptor [Chroococcus sp. FPU101]
MKRMKLELFFPSLWLTGAISVCVAQPVWAQVIQITQITEIRLETTENGLDLIVQSDGTSPSFTQNRTGNTLLVELKNAQLRLPNGARDFQEINPLPGIASIQVIQQSSNVLITIVGIDAEPVAEVNTSSQGLLISLTESEEIVTEEDEIVIVATQETPPENSYAPPQETSVSRDGTSILDTPQDIDVVPQQVIEDQNNTTVSESLRNVSGVTSGRVSTSSLSLTPVIRGFESLNILRNGIRDDTQRFFGGITTNIERIEVLKGPASILFGQGNLGGTVNIVTKPPLADPLYNLEFSAGQFNFYRPVIDLGGPLTSDRTALYRLVSSYETSDTFQDFERIDRRFIVAPAITLKIGDKGSITFDGEFIDAKTHGSGPELPSLGTAVRNPNGKLEIGANLGEPSLTESESSLYRFGYRLDYQISEQWSINNQFLIAFGTTPEETGNVFVLPVSLAADNRTLTRILADNPSQQTNYTLNTSIVGNIQATSWMTHKLLFGIEYAYEENEDKIIFSDIDRIDIFNPVYKPESVRNRRAFQDTYSTINSWGFYLQDQITFFEKFILVVGGRFDIAEQDFIDQLREENNIYRQDNIFSPRIGLIYKPIERISLYASFGQSFEPVTGQNFEGQFFEPEQGTQYEVGIKAELIPDRLITTLAFYDLTRTNYIEQDPGNVGFQIQIGEQKSRGIELDIVGEILPGWNIIGSYAYTDAVITDDERTDFIDNVLPNVPEHAAGLWTTYILQQGVLQGLGFGMGVFFEGDQEGDLENSFVLPSYVRADAAIYYRRGALNLAVNFKNLFNNRYFEGSRNDLRVIPGAPFSVVGTISVEF